MGRIMIRELALILYIGFLMIMPFGVTRTISQINLSNQHELARVEPKNICLAEGDVSNALQKLSTGSQSEVNQTQELLLKKSSMSPKCREQIVSALIRAMDKPNLDFQHDRASFYLWRFGSELLGDLKAVEALDLLISHLDLDDGEFHSSMVNQPALRGVIKMGSVAVPKLSAVLRQSSDRNIRLDAVYCISQIGGRSAMRVLKQALPSESDECVSRFILVTINAFKNNRFPNQITSKDRGKWFSAFTCNE